MNLFSAARDFSKKLNMRVAQSVFTKAVSICGGEDALAELFKSRRAHTIWQQAALAKDLVQAGTIKELSPVKTRELIDVARLEADKLQLAGLLGSRDRLLNFLRENKAAHVRDQRRVVTAELARLGHTPTPASSTTAPTQTISAAPLVIKCAPGKSVTPVKAVTPQPEPERAGVCTLAQATARTAEIFGKVPTSATWNDLESTFAANGHIAPWARGGPRTSRYDREWVKREASIEKLFPSKLTASRADFDRLNATDRRNFLKSGGRLHD